VKALSIRQPWAWMILHGGKDIENREWPTRFRGRVLIHASKGMTRDEYADAFDFAISSGALPDLQNLPRLHFDTMERGGIVGSVEIVDCVTRSDSRWFMGTYGFVLRNPVVLPFQPYRGALGFFDVPTLQITVFRHAERVENTVCLFVGLLSPSNLSTVACHPSIVPPNCWASPTKVSSRLSFLFLVRRMQDVRIRDRRSDARHRCRWSRRNSPSYCIDLPSS